MDTTQALDWGPEDIADDEQEEAIQVGSLRMSYPEGQSELHPLHTGQNIVGRRGSQPQKDDERLERWRGEYSRNGTVSGLFLDSSLISSPHAIIYVEKGGELCFVKDMNSKNKTFLERGSSLLRLQSGDRYSINNGDTLRFGNVSCQMDVDQAAAALNAQGQAQGERAQGPSTGLPAQDATQAYMSIGDAMEEEGGEGAAAAEAGAAAAVGEEAAGSRGVAAEQPAIFLPTQVELPAPEAGLTGTEEAAAVGPEAMHGGPGLAAGPPGRSPTRSATTGDGGGGPPSRSPTRSRTTGNLGLDYDEGDSIWLPPLSGATTASQQEVMSPPKDDSSAVRLRANTGIPSVAPSAPLQMPLQPIEESPQTALQGATQLAEPSLGDQLLAGGNPASGGAEAGPSGSSFSLRPPPPAGPSEGTPRIGPNTEAGTPQITSAEERPRIGPDTAEGTPRIEGPAEGTPRIGGPAEGKSLLRPAEGTAPAASTEGTLPAVSGEGTLEAVLTEGKPEISSDSEEEAPTSRVDLSSRPAFARFILADTQNDSLGISAPQEEAPVAAATEPQHTQLEGTQPAGPDLSAAKAEATPQQPAFTPKEGTPPAAMPEQATAAVPEEATPQTAATPEEAAVPEQAATPAAAPASASFGGWRVKKKAAPAQETAHADAAPLPAQQGATEADKAGSARKAKAAEVDFGAHVAKKVLHSPRLEYVPPAEQAQLQASSGGWMRKGLTSVSQNPSQTSDTAPVLAPASPPAAGVPSSQERAPDQATALPVPNQATSPNQGTPPEWATAPNQAAVPDQVTVTPRQVAAADQTPVRPLWQDLLSDVLPGAEGGNTGQGSDSAKLEPPAVDNAGPAEPDRANERARAPDDAPAAGAEEGSGAGRGPGAAPESEPLNTEVVSSALANVGDLAACLLDTQAPDTAAAARSGADASGVARRGGRRLPASVRAAGHSSIPEEPGHVIAEAAALDSPAAAGTEAEAAGEPPPRPRSGRGAAAARRGRGRGPRVAEAATAAAPEQALAAEPAPEQAPGTDLPIPAAIAPEQAAAGTETEVQEGSAADAAQENARDAAGEATAAPKEATKKKAPKRGRRPAKALEQVAAAESPAPTNAEQAAATVSGKSDALFGGETKQLAPPSGSVQKMFSRRGRKSSASAAAEEAAGSSQEAAQGADKKATAPGKSKAPLTESQTAAHTLAQVRTAHGQEPRVSPVPEDAAAFPAGGTRGKGNASVPAPATAGAAKRGRAGAAEKPPREGAAAAPAGAKRAGGGRRGPPGPGKNGGASEGPATETAAAKEQEKAVETEEAGAPAKRRRKQAESQDTAGDAKAAADAKPGRGRKRGASIKPEQAIEAGADITDDVEADVAAAAPLAKRGRKSAAAVKGSQAQEAPVEAEEEAGPKTGAATRKSRAPAAVAAKEDAEAASAAATDAVATAPPTAKRSGRKKLLAGAAAGKTKAASPADAAAAEEPVAASTVAKRGGRTIAGAALETVAAAQAAEPAAAAGTAARQGRGAAAAAAAESPAKEAAAKLPPPAKRSRAAAASQTPAAEEAKETEKGKGKKQAAVKRGRKSTATAEEAAEEAPPAEVAEPEQTTKRGQKRKSAAEPESQAGDGQASNCGRKPAAASQATEAGPSMQLRGADAKPPSVLISTCVDAKLRQAITRTVERLGGTVTSSPADFSVFVTLDAARGNKDRGFTKSLNALSALASGSPIVSEKWVDACARSDAFVSAREFLLKDPAAEKKFGFSLAAAWEAAQQSLLLHGVHVFLTPGLLAAEVDKGEGLRMLVQRAGGNIAKTVPKKLPEADAAQWLLLGDEKSVQKEVAWAKKALSKGLKLHGRSALITALITQHLDREADILLET